MSTNEQTPLSQPAFAVWNTLGKEQISQDMDKPPSDAALREYCDKNYHQLLPIIAEKVHQNKVQQEKLKALKAHLNFKEVSPQSESGTPSGMRDLKKRIGSGHIRSVSESPKPRHGRPESPRKRDPERKTMFKRLKKGVFHRLRDKGKNVSAHSDDSRRQSYHSNQRDTKGCYQSSRSRGTEPASEKHHNKIASSHKTEALSESEGSARGQWKSRSKKQRSSIEDDDLSQPWVCEETDPFTPPAKVERWSMPTWCHMFNSTLTESARVWFNDLPPESVDSYDDLKEAFLVNFRQQKKCIKDPVKIHHIKQREGESTEDFVRRSERRQDKFTLLSKSPKEILALEKGKFKAPPPMMTTVKKRNNNKFCEFHEEVGHNTDECMHLKRQIEELQKNGKLSHVIKELKQNNRKDQPKANKKGKTSSKDKALVILMVQPWKRVARQRITESFSPNLEVSFPHLEEEGFSGEIIWPLRKLSLLVKIGDEEHLTSAWINFVVVRSSSLYNGIIERLGVRKIQAVLSTAHRMIKFPIAGGLLTLKSSKIIPIECVAVSGPEEQSPAAHQAIEERIKVAINPDYPEQTIMIGSTLTKEGRNTLCDLL
ncbi:reverse transcriptase domain-containing protein [Tanacetum coccineum]|uniref:Reverse transcriptase domain-containing protein n=1 Tax=Tanacetum coccineum TaxID=301880 RepID=A0ABQ5ICX8_9ASTR